MTWDRGKGKGASFKYPQKITRITLGHRAIIDDMIMNPRITHSQLVERHGYTKTWISHLLNNELFKKELEIRRAQLVDKIMVATLEDKYHNVLARSLDILQEKLQESPDKVNDALLIKALEVSNKALRIGQKEEQKEVDGGQHLETLAHRLRELQHKAIGPGGNTYEGNVQTVTEVGDAEVVTEETKDGDGLQVQRPESDAGESTDGTV